MDAKTLIELTFTDLQVLCDIINSSSFKLKDAPIVSSVFQKILIAKESITPKIESAAEPKVEDAVEVPKT